MFTYPRRSLAEWKQILEEYSNGASCNSLQKKWNVSRKQFVHYRKGLGIQVPLRHYCLACKIELTPEIKVVGHNSCKTCYRTTQQERTFAFKSRVFQHYSPGPRCQNPNCLVPGGCKDLRCLSIDHINGGGTKHRADQGQGISLYRWLEKNSYPAGFQVLCMNCQWIKRHENHEFRKKTVLS